MRKKTNPEDLGVIEDHVTYPLGQFMLRAGIGRHALRQLRARGLRVIKTGGRAFVRGRDFSAFLATLEPDGGEL